MPAYIYKAKSGPTKMVSGNIKADTRDLAIKKLNQRGYFPVEISEQSFSQENILGAVFIRIKRAQLVTFTRQMADLIDAGIPIFKSLTIIKEQTENPKLKTIIGDVSEKVRGGKGLSEALADYPNLFSNLYIALVKSGELGGNLDIILLRLADLLEKEDDLKSRVRSAMAYPLLMIMVGVATIIVLVTWVIPRLVYMFEEVGQVLPLPTKMLLGVSRICSHYWWIILVLIIGSILLYYKVINTAEGMRYIDRLKLKIPVFKQLIIKRAITRFSRTLGTLLDSGVEMISSLEAAIDVVENRIIQDQLNTIMPRVRDGARLTEVLRDIKQFPILISNMVAVGEESGHLDDILLKISNSYDRKVDYSIKTMTNLLEPTIILVMGLIIGFIVISILLPIFTIDFASW